MRRPWIGQDAWLFVAALLASPGLDVLIPTDRHAAVAARVIDEISHLAGNLVYDAHTAILPDARAWHSAYHDPGHRLPPIPVPRAG
jgi:hypothetical protein